MLSLKLRQTLNSSRYTHSILNFHLRGRRIRDIHYCSKGAAASGPTDTENSDKSFYIGFFPYPNQPMCGAVKQVQQTFIKDNGVPAAQWSRRTPWHRQRRAINGCTGFEDQGSPQVLR